MPETPTTAEAIITSAFEAVGITAPGESLSPADANGALARLNLLMGTLRLQPLTQGVVSREEFSLTADKGGPDDPYTIGSGGDFDTTKPIKLEGASILMVQSDPTYNVEVPRAVLTDDGWQAIQIKTLGATVFTDVYYNQTYQTLGLGTINLWPVPNTTLNKLVLYMLQPLRTFSNLTAQYYLPPGCEDMLQYQLARRLLTPYGVTDPATVADIKELAIQTMGVFKRANAEMTDLPTDPALTRDPQGGYNILTGTGGGNGG